MKRRDRRRRKQRRRREAKAAAPRVPQTEHSRPLELFRVTAMRRTVVRCVQVLVLLVASVALWAAHDAAFNPADVLNQRGEAVSSAVRYGTAAFLFVIGAGGAVGIVVYGWCYVTHAVWDPQSGERRLTLIGFFRVVRADIPIAEASCYVRRDGVSRAGGVLVNAPYYSIRVAGRRLPFIVDLQGEFPHGDLFHQVLLGATEFETPTGRAARRKPSG